MKSLGATCCMPGSSLEISGVVSFKNNSPRGSSGEAALPGMMMMDQDAARGRNG
jgi:hypothetical protein